MMPNGHVLFCANCYSGSTNTHIYEFDPTNTTTPYTDVTPSGYNLATNYPYMLMLPSGQVLLSNAATRQLEVYTPNGAPNNAWRPTITSIQTAGSSNTLTLTGIQLNGISEGAAYGDDAEMATNYPLVQYRVPGSSTVAYARTANWSSTGVLGGTETVDLTVPARGIYLVNAIANGIASPTILSVQMTSSTDNLVIRNDPNNSGNVQVVSGSTVLAEVALSGIDKIVVTCDNNTDNLTVSYQYGNPLPGNGMDYGSGSGVDTLNVSDPTTTNQTFTLGTHYVQRSGSAFITFFNDGINFVNILGGSGNNTYIVAGTEPTFATTINTGSGADTVDILGTSGPLTVTTTGSTNNRNTINIGDAGSLTGIQGNVTINNTPSRDHLVVNDSADSANRTVTMNNLGIAGLSTGSINWTGASLDTLAVTGGSGSNTYTINSPDAYQGTTLNTGSGNGSTVNVRATTGPLAVNLQNTLRNGGEMSLQEAQTN